MKAFCLACVVLLFCGCSGPSYCERRLVPINGRGTAGTVAPDWRRRRQDLNHGDAHQGQRS
jgi:hypothetical protein